MTKKYRPTTPGLRGTVIEKRDVLTRRDEKSRAQVKPTKSLLRFRKNNAGRNNLGRITCRHRGGGARRFYRIVDFRRQKLNVPARVQSIEYDPNRSAFVALIAYADGEKSYIIAPEGLKPGMEVSTRETAPFDLGCCMRLKHMPIGSVIHNIEMNPERGAAIVRSAGGSAQLMGRNEGYAILRLPSAEVRRVSENCYATFGVVSNAKHNLRNEGKAGRKRHQGIRPTVRGTAMNPVDHPHGGGEGRQNSYIPRSPWGWQTKGKRTRSKSKSLKHLIKRRK